MKMKRLCLGVGGKGGVGKTIVIRSFVDLLLQSKINYQAYDADTENPELYNYYQEHGNSVSLMDFTDVKDASGLIGSIDKDRPDLVVIDMPAASARGSRDTMTKFDLMESSNLGYRITLIAVMNQGYSAIESLKQMFDYCGYRVDYVVVLNQYWDKEFTRWYGCKLRAEILKLNGIEIKFPPLEDYVYDVLLEANLPFSTALSSPDFGAGDKMLLRGFMRRVGDAFQPAVDYLGLNQEQ